MSKHVLTFFFVSAPVDGSQILSDQSDDDGSSQSAPIPTGQARRPKNKSANQTKNKKRLVKHVPVSKSNIARMLIALVNKGEYFIEA